MEVQTEREFEEFKKLVERHKEVTEKLSKIRLTRPASEEHLKLIKEWGKVDDELRDFLNKYVGEF